VAGPLLGGKRWVLYCSRAEARKQDFCVNVSAPLLEARKQGWFSTITLLLQQSRGQKIGLVQHHHFSACSRVEARKQGWFSTITFLLAAEQRPEKKDFCINLAALLLEGKALGIELQQSRGQKT
jgi:hypothetical protein